jgi:hypothetical protein
MRSPRAQLAEAAERFGLIGPRASKVATVLVADTDKSEAS